MELRPGTNEFQAVMHALRYACNPDFATYRKMAGSYKRTAEEVFASMVAEAAKHDESIEAPRFAVRVTFTTGAVKYVTHCGGLTERKQNAGHFNRVDAFQKTEKWSAHTHSHVDNVATVAWPVQ